ncbi:MAG TPA: hypothetical protein VHV32_19070 [Candidatus Angelobacter sp.]|jgi:predicted transcriptional regulator|nr:hypothetical protein [Candidatus Angelobacter sp.]
MDLDPDKAYDALIRAGESWADAEAAAALLEETRKSMLAKLMNESAVASIAGKEMVALASEEYREYVDGMVKARAAANKARVRYDSAKVLAELRRTKESTRRAEMSMR